MYVFEPKKLHIVRGDSRWLAFWLLLISSSIRIPGDLKQPVWQGETV